MLASEGRIWRIAASPAVTAGLKCAPEIRASVWISMKRMKTWTSPMTSQWTYGAGFAGDAATPYTDTTTAMTNTSVNVPKNSAKYAAGPRSTYVSTTSVRGESGTLAPAL